VLVLNGTGIGHHIGIGKAIVLNHGRRDIPKYHVEPNQVETEVERFRSALDRTRDELQRIQKGIPENSPKETNAFLEVHILMLQDPAITEQPVRAIQKYRYNAEWALKTETEKLVKLFENIEDPYLRSKKNDVHQVVERIFDELVVTNDSSPLSSDKNLDEHMVIALDLTPSEVVALHNRGVNGFITSLGGPISHTAILARSIGIPAVVGLHNAVNYIQHGDLIAIDGHTGTIIVNPDEPLLNEFQQRQIYQSNREKQLKSLRKQPAITIDGQNINLFANIELPDDINTLESVGIQAVGLYRTEFLFMNRTQAPNESEQYFAYRDVIANVEGPVTIRTLDLGADKQVDGGRIDGASTINPALGLRAIRLCLNEPALFRPQLRAILRASAHGQTRIMIPMLSSLSELEQAIEIVNEVKHELGKEEIAFNDNIPIGGMIEVPAAAISADLFAEKLDFLSIGTNDLIQYTLAIDRIDDEVNYLYDPLHPSVLRLIKNVIEAGKTAGIPVSMCGEMAGDPEYTRLLLGLGLLEFSMEPKRLLEVKEIVRNSNLEKLFGKTQEILSCNTSSQLRSLVDRINQD
tara:strand:- start:1330 stop:3063 length:1734 start_codon:yes stop_codon:yes gene_type:complete